MVTYENEEYKNKLETRYTVKYIDNEIDMDYVSSGRCAEGEQRYKKRIYNCIDDAMSFYMVSLFNPIVSCAKLFEEIILDGDIIRESYVELNSCIGSTLKTVINASLHEDAKRANRETEALEKRLYLVEKWFKEFETAKNTFNKFVVNLAQSENKMTAYRYYSTLRPVAPGTYPRPKEAKNIVNFDDRTFVDDINRYAWGYIEYEKELEWSEAEQYDLEWNSYTKMEITA